MEAVVDTNVIVSGLLSASGPHGEIVDLCLSGKIIPVFDDRIIAEYYSVLLRPRFKFDPNTVNNFIIAVYRSGKLCLAQRLGVTIPDPADRCFYECALASYTRILITGNKKHFPPDICTGIKIFSHREAIDYIAIR